MQVALLILTLFHEHILFVAQNHTQGRVRCMLFAVSGQVMPIWLAPNGGVHVDDLDVSHLFQNGYVSYRVTTFPILGCAMIGHWRIFVTVNPAKAGRNKAIKAIVGRRWHGNVVFTRYSNGDTGTSECLEDVGKSSLDFIVPFLDAWIRERQSQTYDPDTYRQAQVTAATSEHASAGSTQGRDKLTSA
ncbi:hypothetical protein CVT26_004161 [Gymnopilus dilepis]|uniref:Helitron helicase-like domain-containing protein n=1 Tax=Gymnopilus dilepis TaxID=231916 RepID=A0A409WN58_9AGAR|nr:hypothetical protein CVT26_004161 [Gymnopilus dilepis]